MTRRAANRLLGIACRPKRTAHDKVKWRQLPRRCSAFRSRMTSRQGLRADRLTKPTADQWAGPPGSRGLEQQADDE